MANENNDSSANAEPGAGSRTGVVIAAGSGTALVIAAMDLAAIIAPSTEVAPADENEDPVDHTKRLLDMLAEPARQLVNAEQELEDEIAGLQRQLSAQKGATTRAKNEAAALEAQLPARPRPLGRDAWDGSAEELLELIEDADDIQIAFSDGEREIPGIAPRSISGDAWKRTGTGLALNVPSLEVTGPAGGGRLAGYALLLDGEQVAFARRPDVVPINANQRYDLGRDVIF